MHPPTGDGFLLDDGRVRLEVGALAAVLREARVDGVRITETVPADALPSHGCGIVLAPWPNRVRDARWVLDGEAQQLDVTDVARGGAIHGLLRNAFYRLRERDERSLTLGATIFPQHGWPFLLDTWVRYALEEDGIAVTHGVENRARRRAPWAVGAHPYLRVGETPADELALTIAGATVVELDERLNPVATVEAPAELELRAGRRVGELDLNVAYGSLANREARAEVARLTAPDGASTRVWADPAFRWLQAFTPRDFPVGPGRTGTAVALEPMTAPADALNSGTDLAWLEPGESREASWGVSFRPGGVS